MPKTRCQGVLICLVFNVTAVVSFSQDVPAERADSVRKEWFKQRVLEFGTYKIELEDARPRALTLEAQPILDWSNPERGTFFGATFLWTYAGRPELIADAYGRGQWLRHEFQSVSAEPIVAERGGSLVHRFQPGIQWRDLAGAPKPSESSPLRLSQMRRQAQRFQATVATEKPMGELEPSYLRLLPQPVYRSPDPSTVDVAIFLFVQGTDPECALLLEVTPEKTWRYALARQTMAALKVELDGQTVLDLSRFRQLTAEAESSFLFLIPPEAKAEPK